MKIHRPESRHDKLPYLFFIRQLVQSLINPAFSLDCLGSGPRRRLGTHRLAGRNEEQEDWQEDAINNPANRAREHRKPNPSSILPIKNRLSHRTRRLKRSAGEYTTRLSKATRKPAHTKGPIRLTLIPLALESPSCKRTNHADLDRF